MLLLNRCHASPMLSQGLIVRRQADDIQQCLVTRKKNSRGKGLSGFRFYSGVVTV